VSLLVVPVLTRRLSVELFGVLETITAFQFGISTFAALNLDTALVRYFYEAETAAARRTFVTTIFAATLVACAVSAGLAMVASSEMSVWLFHSTTYARAVAMSAAGVPFMVLTTLALTVLRLERQAVAFGVISVLAVLIQAGAVAGAALLFPNNVQAVVAGQLGSQAFVAILAASRMRPLLGAVLSRVDLRRAMAFSLPYLPSVVITFAAASKVQALVLALAQAFWNAWKPHAMSRMRDADGTHQMVNIASASVAVLAFGAVAVAALARTFLTIYAGPAYAAAAMTAALLVLGTCVNFGITGFWVLRLEMAERTGYVSLGQGATFLAVTGLNFWLIPRLGAEGAALAVVGSGLVQAVVLRAVVKRVESVSLPTWVWLPPAAAGALMIWARVTGRL
jgi:O-antigen/teichoic acid export membrane protein